MKKIGRIGMFLFLLVGTFVLAGCEDSSDSRRSQHRDSTQQEEIQKEEPTAVPTQTAEELKQQEEKEFQQNLQDYADYVVVRVHYIKDPRTNLCFACLSDDLGKAPSSLTNVPCNDIPVSLLGVANLDKKEEKEEEKK